jgi:hypothetical protein
MNQFVFLGWHFCYPPVKDLPLNSKIIDVFMKYHILLIFTFLCFLAGAVDVMTYFGSSMWAYNSYLLHKGCIICTVILLFDVYFNSEHNAALASMMPDIIIKSGFGTTAQCIVEIFIQILSSFISYSYICKG